MSDVIENTVESIEGETETPQKRQRLFSNLSALLDYCKVFNIDNAAFGKTLHSGNHIFILEYYSNED